MFSVIVGNLGTVYDGDDFSEAEKTYDEYVEMSHCAFGRASSQEVILMANGEVEFHYEGMTCACNECGLDIPRDEALLVTLVAERAKEGEAGELNLTFCSERCKTKTMSILNPAD
jgi:hypothetical protein